jgi:hypothetical protein
LRLDVDVKVSLVAEKEYRGRVSIECSAFASTPSCTHMMSYCRTQPAGRGRSFVGFGKASSLPSVAVVVVMTLALVFLGLEALRVGMVMPDRGNSTTAGSARVLMMVGWSRRIEESSEKKRCVSRGTNLSVLHLS